MAGRRDPWPEGRDAWSRLDGWDHAGPVGEAAGSRAGDAALDALSDLGVVRRLLDQTELAAVRAARANRKSWAEIATRLGMTRQSAWERWRDLDGDEPSGASRAPARAGDEPSRARGQRAVDEAARHAAAALTAVVPDVGGLSWENARDTLLQAHLVAVNADPDLPPFLGWELSGYVVVDQKPGAGARVALHSPVTLWLERGPGPAGVRSPLNPSPPLKTIRGAVDETTGESVR
ncbi:PASTA domain-containing protein [Pseudonocardia sp. CA-142604]|uniref:PASTA domain-containing protein n=1 Tax=Pseudonocardia sp. CA-142604 TaxID=3240024 RepID=UPI003D8C5D05